MSELKEYQFIVPCSYYYQIEAKTEEEAKQILIDRGGLDISGDLLLDEESYKKAECIGVMDNE